MSKKMKLSLMLDEYESELLRRAMEKLFPKADSEMFRTHKQRIVRLALSAYLRGVLLHKKKLSKEDTWGLNQPMIAELRYETEKETADRIADVVPGSSNGPDWHMPNRWN